MKQHWNRRLLCLLCTTVLLLSLLLPVGASAAASGACGENVRWQISGGTLVISGTGPMQDYEWGLKPYPGGGVTQWPETPFVDYAGQIRAIRVLNGVTHIGKCAFSFLDKVESVELAPTVQSFGTSCFSGCSSLKALSIPEGTTRIPESFASDCTQLERVDIPGSVKTVEWVAFANDHAADLVLAGSTPEFEEPDVFDTFSGRLFCQSRYVEDYLQFAQRYSSSISYMTGPIRFSVNSNCDAPMALNTTSVNLNAAAPSEQLRVTGGSGRATVRWTSSDPSVATVDSRGVVTAVSRGTALISAVANDGADRALLFCCASVAYNDALEPILPRSLRCDYPTCISSAAVSAGKGLDGIDLAKFYEDDTSNQYYQQILAATKEAVAGCRTDYEKAYAIEEWVFRYLTYDDRYLPMGDSIEQIYSVFLNRRTQCMGYTYLTGLMLTMAGIPNAGVVANNIGHTWNLALCGGKWVNIDSTWGEFDFGFNDPDHGYINVITFGDGGDCGLAVWDLTGVKLVSVGWHPLERDNLTSITVPDFVTEICSGAFDHAENLTSVMIPIGVKAVNTDIFADAKHNLPSLTDVYYEGSPAQWSAVAGGTEALSQAGSAVRFHPGTAAPDVAAMADVSEKDYYYKAVAWVLNTGLASPASATRFGANDPAPRWEVVDAIWKAMGSPEPGISSVPFTDVSPSAPYYKAVLWAYETGVTVGKDAAHFGPNETVTRAGAVTFMYRAADPVLKNEIFNPFRDVKESDYYYVPVYWAHMVAGVTEGTDGQHFTPNEPVSRGQLMTFIYRWLVAPYWTDWT